MFISGRPKTGIFAAIVRLLSSGASAPRNPAVFGPVGFRREHGPAYGAAFQLIPALADLGVQDRVRRFLIGFPLRILKPSLAGIG